MAWANLIGICCKYTVSLIQSPSGFGSMESGLTFTERVLCSSAFCSCVEPLLRSLFQPTVWAAIKGPFCPPLVAARAVYSSVIMAAAKQTQPNWKQHSSVALRWRRAQTMQASVRADGLTITGDSRWGNWQNSKKAKQKTESFHFPCFCSLFLLQCGETSCCRISSAQFFICGMKDLCLCVRVCECVCRVRVH